jgi:hypothetical protein
MMFLSFFRGTAAKEKVAKWHANKAAAPFD